MVAEPQSFTPKTWTYDEVSTIADDVRRELYDGDIWEMPSPTLNHQDIIGRLYLAFMLWASNYGGKAFLSPIDLFISERRYFIPDFVFYSADQMMYKQVEKDPKRLTVPPTLVVEVLSESTARNDRVRKLHAYAQFGVANYWIVDPALKTIEAFELRGDLYQVIAAHTEDETFSPTAFPELQIDLQKFFA